MSIKAAACWFAVNTMSLLAALLIFHYRAGVGHAIAYGIPWESKFFWPLGSSLFWILLAEVLLGLLMWFGAYWFDVEDHGLTFSLYIITATVELLACVPAFHDGYIVFGLVNLVAGFATFIALTSSFYWTERRTTKQVPYQSQLRQAA